ncbi:MAG: IS630 family transposase [Timaviella obliquedivisa GSE-PSE-MK23-08B]|jgi:transposase|nr:IS630 family transposase [Timaviella obliquedivisa GSE-PSE-MK23-08B]
MPVSKFLSSVQQDTLQNALRESEDSHQRQRVLMLLLRNDGKTYEEIMDFIGCSYRSVAYWCVHGNPDDLESLKDGRAQGNYRKATPEYIEQLLRVVEQTPMELGYEFGRWTTARLAKHLEETTQIKMSSVQVGRILVQKKYAYLWAKYSLEEKQDREKRAAFKEKLEQALARSKASPERLQIWFWDESGFSLRVIRRKQWGKRGKRKALLGKRSRERVNMMGGLRYSDRKQKCYFIEQGNGDSFLESMVNLNQYVMQEWVEKGNLECEFQQNGARILIVLDNASYHQKQEVILQISSECPNLELWFLPPYSPDYNLIELVWHSCKEFIAHRLFQSVGELRDLLDRLINHGELNIQWKRKVKNKGNAILAS